MSGRDNWREFRKRVDVLVRDGVALEEARTRAGQERLAALADRKAELAEEKAARALRAMTCQICARDILADLGTIAHHGYQRPGDGWQTSSCMGARELPFEVSRDVLGVYCGSLLDAAERYKKRREALEGRTAPPFFTWFERNSATGRDKQHDIPVTAETFSAVVEALPPRAWKVRSPRPTFDSTLESNVREATNKEKFFRSEYRRQKARFDGWRPSHERGDGNTWRKL